MREKIGAVRRAWRIDDKSNRRATGALVFTFAVMVLLRGFEANPAFAAVMAVTLGLYARFVLGAVIEVYGDEGGATSRSGSPA